MVVKRLPFQEIPLEDGFQALAGDQDHVPEVQRKVVAREKEGVEREVLKQRTIRVERANGTGSSLPGPSLHPLSIFTEQFGSMHYLVSSPTLRRSNAVLVTD